MYFRCFEMAFCSESVHKVRYTMLQNGHLLYLYVEGVYGLATRCVAVRYDAARRKNSINFYYRIIDELVLT